VTDGIEAALARAKSAAQGQDIWLAGGASLIDQYLAAGLVDEIDISIAPVIMAGGERLFEELQRGALKLTQIRAIDAPGVTHIKYQIG
jgi:dihydrofolate reductase